MRRDPSTRAEDSGRAARRVHIVSGSTKKDFLHNLNPGQFFYQKKIQDVRLYVTSITMRALAARCIQLPGWHSENTFLPLFSQKYYRWFKQKMRTIHFVFNSLLSSLYLPKRSVGAHRIDRRLSGQGDGGQVYTADKREQERRDQPSPASVPLLAQCRRRRTRTVLGLAASGHGSCFVRPRHRRPRAA